MYSYTYSSEAQVTSKQALDYITTYALNDQFLRSMLLDIDATRVLGHIQANQLTWHSSSDTFLSSSRRALVSLADVKINTQIQRVHAFQGTDSSAKSVALNEIREFLKFVSPNSSYIHGRILI